MRLLRRLGKRWGEGDNTKLDLGEVGFEEETWKEVVQDRVDWRIFYFDGFAFFSTTKDLMALILIFGGKR